jgi:hypothetical protein
MTSKRHSRPVRLRRTALPGTTLAVAVVAVTSAITANQAAAAAKPVVLDPNASAARTRVAAGGGHVVSMQATEDGGSSLFELVAGSAPRLLQHFKGDLAWPEVGTDAGGHLVVVASPCSTQDQPLPLPPCSLVAVNIATGKSATVANSKGAYIGDLDHGRAVVARRSADVGVRIALGPAKKGGASTPLPFASVLRPSVDRAREYQATRYVDSIDLSGGTIAATLLAGDDDGGQGGDSQLIRRAVTGSAWSELAHSGYGGASGILRVFRAATVTPTGIRAFYDGGDNDQSYVARWSAAGTLVKKLTARFRVADGAAFDGDHLVAVEAVSVACQEEELVADCPVESIGPYPLG